jgi:hypothetical protein
MKKINRGVNNGKMGRPKKDWIVTLPSGNYSVEQLMELSNSSKNTTLQTFKNNGGKVTLDQNKTHGKRLYIWENKFKGE